MGIATLRACVGSTKVVGRRDLRGCDRGGILVEGGLVREREGKRLREEVAEEIRRHMTMDEIWWNAVIG